MKVVSAGDFLFHLTDDQLHARSTSPLFSNQHRQIRDELARRRGPSAGPVPGVDYSDPALGKSPHAQEIMTALDRGESPDDVLQYYLDENFDPEMARLLVDEAHHHWMASGRGRRIVSAQDSIFLKYSEDYLTLRDVDHSIPSEGHVDGAARWSPEEETKNRYATREEHERLRDLGFRFPEDEDGSYLRWLDTGHAHAIWPNPDGSWVHVRNTHDEDPGLSYIKTTHPDLSGAIRQYRTYLE